MDRTAARVANVLLGNDENEPLLELTVNGPELLFLRDSWIAVTGAEVRGVPGWRPWKVDAGQIVSFTELVRGARAYLAIAGGLEVARVLGGTGTMLSTVVGGWNGRALKTGDRLGVRPGILELEGRWSASADFRATSAGEVTVRFIAGPQWAWFSSASRRALVTEAFKITAKSDRMGLRLSGPELGLDSVSRELLSEGVAFGSVQVPPDGRPIVLMADRQTVGGYPKIAQVTSVDLAKLAQARTGDTVRFKETTLAEAQALYLEQEQSLAMLVAGVRAKVKRS
jgi:antagonist of KipI